MKKVNCRTAFTARDDERVSLICPDDGMTQQHFKLECDVNEIVRRYVQTGDPTLLEGSAPVYADVADLPVNLIDAYESIGRAEEAFMKLPSDVRKSMNNDPALLESWLANQNNRDMAIKHGLINAPIEAVKNEEKNPSEPVKE